MRIKTWIGLVGLVGVVVGMGACSPNRPVVVMEGAEETAAAATAFYEGATATAGAATAEALLPTLTPAPTGTPYIRPADDPAVAPDTVIATVAGHDITVQEFRNRVRYERWAALEALRRIVELSGVEAIDVRDPNNSMAPTVIGYLYTLDDAKTFAETVLTTMIRERIIHQEFINRELPPSPGLVNNLWLRLLGIEVPAENSGQLPDDFDTLLDEFMQKLAVYTDISVPELRFMLTERSEQQAVLDSVGAEAEVDSRTVELNDIVVATEAEALEIKQQLEDGADFATLAQEYSLSSGARGNGGDLGYFGRGTMVGSFEEAAFGAEPGVLVGPIETEFGYHILQVTDQRFALRLERLLVADEADAETAIARLRAGDPVADLVEALSVSPGTDGDLGFMTRDDLPASVADQVFSAGVGDVVGPFQTSDGLLIFAVTDRQLDEVQARHILVETAAEAQDVLRRLEAGEDFATLAGEVSIDPDAKGDGGNLGFVTESQLPDALAEAAFNADLNEIFGPIQTDEGYHVAKITNFNVNLLSPDQYDEVKALHFQNWLRRQVDAVEIDPVWEEVYPSDPQPEHVAAFLVEMEEAMNEALQALQPTPTAEG